MPDRLFNQIAGIVFMKVTMYFSSSQAHWDASAPKALFGNPSSMCCANELVAIYELVIDASETSASNEQDIKALIAQYSVVTLRSICCTQRGCNESQLGFNLILKKTGGVPGAPAWVLGEVDTGICEQIKNELLNLYLPNSKPKL